MIPYSRPCAKCRKPYGDHFLIRGSVLCLRTSLETYRAAPWGGSRVISEALRKLRAKNRARAGSQ